MLALPIMDLTNDAPAVQAETIRKALGTTGFFEVRNSGLDPGMIERMFDLVCQGHVVGPRLQGPSRTLKVFTHPSPRTSLTSRSAPKASSQRMRMGQVTTDRMNRH